MRGLDGRAGGGGASVSTCRYLQQTVAVNEESLVRVGMEIMWSEGV